MKCNQKNCPLQYNKDFNCEIENPKLCMYFSSDDYSTKHLKGFLFDSLVYRYIRAREQMAEYEYLRDKQSNVSNHTEEWLYYRIKANGDIARFIEILEEAIGEHD